MTPDLNRDILSMLRAYRGILGTTQQPNEHTTWEVSAVIDQLERESKRAKEDRQEEML